MKPIEQTITAPPDGNCFAACVASPLELPLGQVPNYLEPHGVWFENWQKWLSERNLTLYCWTASYTPKGYLTVRITHSIADALLIAEAGRKIRMGLSAGALFQSVKDERMPWEKTA